MKRTLLILALCKFMLVAAVPQTQAQQKVTFVARDGAKWTFDYKGSRIHTTCRTSHFAYPDLAMPEDKAGDCNVLSILPGDSFRLIGLDEKWSCTPGHVTIVAIQADSDGVVFTRYGRCGGTAYQIIYFDTVSIKAKGKR